MSQDDVGVEVPYERLSADALRGVIEAFVLQEGTDYGVEYTLDEKVARVMEQLRRGKASVVFDPSSQTTNIVPRGR
jgi:uncharacterized protein YheU (UPF0270 family)